MLFQDTYRTIAAPAEGILRDRGSKFLAFARPVRSEQEAKDQLELLRKEHPKANHHCWALRLGPDRQVFRFQDDGEPAGTAGRPILNSLLSADVSDVLMVVVRYFGGTLLGVTGLIHAYKSASLAALEAATISERVLSDAYRIRFPFDQMNQVMRLIKEHQLEILQQDADEHYQMDLLIRKSLLEEVLARLQKIQNLTYTYRS